MWWLQSSNSNEQRCCSARSLAPHVQADCVFTFRIPLAGIFTHSLCDKEFNTLPRRSFRVFCFSREQRGSISVRPWIRRGEGHLHRRLSLTAANTNVTSIIDWINTETGDCGLGWKLHYQGNHSKRSTEIHKSQEPTLAGSLNQQFMKRWTHARKMRYNIIGHFSSSLKHIFHCISL